MRDEAQAALYSSRARGDNAASARASEVDALTGEAERLLGEVAALRSQLDRERAVAASAGGGGDGEDVVPSLRAQVISYRRAAESAEVEAARLQASVAGLQEEGRRWAEVLEAQRVAQARAAAEAEARVESLRGEISAVTVELSKRPTLTDVQARGRGWAGGLGKVRVVDPCTPPPPFSDAVTAPPACHRARRGLQCERRRG